MRAQNLNEQHSCTDTTKKKVTNDLLIKEQLRKKSRDKRRHLREKRRRAAEFVKLNKKDVGASAYKASLNGFTKKGKLPHHFNELFNEIRKLVYSQKSYIDKKGVERNISARGHRKIFEILVVLLSNCELMSGKIGLAKKLYMDTVSHDAFMLQHAKRFGYAISSTNWYRYIEIIKAIGIFKSEVIRIYNAEDKTTRSEASYKFFSKKFLTKIGVFKDHISASIKLAYQKAIKKGLSFTWKVKNEPLIVKNLELFTPPSNYQPN